MSTNKNKITWIRTLRIPSFFAGVLILCGICSVPLNGDTNQSVQNNQRNTLEPSNLNVVISFRSESNNEREIARTLANRHQATIHHVYQHTFSGAAITLPAQNLNKLLSNRHVKQGRVSMERTFQLFGQQASNSSSDRSRRSGFKERRFDPLHRVKAREKQEHGKDVDIALIDNGVRRKNSKLQTSVKQQVRFGDHQSSESIPQYKEHGTQLGKLIAGSSRKPSRENGIASEANLYSIDAFDRYGQAYLRDLLASFDWILKTNRENQEINIEVLNLGFGTRLFSNAGIFRSALGSLIDHGISVVAAAGNTRDQAHRYLPGGLEEVISVSGVLTEENRFAPPGNYGPNVDILAPISHHFSPDTNRKSTTFKGTSISSAYVTGAVANFLGAKTRSYDPATVERILVKTGTFRYWQGYPGNEKHMSPLLNVRRLLLHPRDSSHLIQNRSAKVIEVYDGDTMKLRYPNGRTDEIRVLGVDTPETYIENQPWEFEGVPNTEEGKQCLREWGRKATDFAKKLLANEEVQIIFDEHSDRRDPYNRILGYINVDGTPFNKRLIQNAFARMYDSQFEKRPSFERLEQKAQREGLGLWGACAE